MHFEIWLLILVVLIWKGESWHMTVLSSVAWVNKKGEQKLKTFSKQSLGIGLNTQDFHISENARRLEYSVTLLTELWTHSVTYL
jgi:hypothetical protein